MAIATHLLVISIIIQGLLISNAIAEDIPEIEVFSTSALEPSDFELNWKPVQYKNEIDPIIGIKVKVWKIPCEIKTTIYNDVHGNKMKIVKSERLEFNRTTVPQELPERVFVVKPDELSVTVPDIEPEVWYHMRALAFTATVEGPYSNPIQFKINTGDKNDKKNSCERIISQTPVEDDDELLL